MSRRERVYSRGVRVLRDRRARPLWCALWRALCVFVLAGATGCESAPAADVDGGRDAGADAGRLIILPDEREPCARREPLRRPLFGDLHVHTALSFDAAAYDVRTRPRDAYRFARGEEIGLPPYDASGAPTRTLRLRRPLDFAAVTDHSEFLAETALCVDPESPAYDSTTCRSYRDANTAAGGYGSFTASLAVVPPRRVAYCLAEPAVCAATLASAWQEVQDAAEEAYDRTSACAFTTLVAYEWTGTAAGNNLHRNVIFRTRTVPRVPVSFIDAYTPERLWSALESTCLESGTECDVLAIPHNGNLSGGDMFVPLRDDDAPYTREDAARRARLEPLVEIYQHKGSSECLDGVVDPLGSEDELCRFEEIHPVTCRDGAEPPGCADRCAEGGGIGFFGGCVEGSDFTRGALRVGLRERARVGVNPFELGIIGSTDTHQSLAGGTEESTFRGHLGDSEDEPAELLNASPGVLLRGLTVSAGGLAVVWAEENSRPAIFDALRRRETYATSGTRIVLRFFGGAGIAADACDSMELARLGYEGGVPMGGELVGASDAPRFVVAAMRDADASRLASIEIVKLWVDAAGDTHERVFAIAGAVTEGTLDAATCANDGGVDQLCATFVDPEWDPAHAAAYYARVVEIPSCRWSRYVCIEAGVDCATIAADDPLASCCPIERHVIRERAWSSPIWTYPTAD